MRPNHALALARYQRRKDFTTVEVQWKFGHRTYTYKALKSERLKVRDYVIVLWPTGDYAVAKVVAVHDKPNIKGTEPWDFKWIVQKIDVARHQRLTKMDHDFTAFVAAQDTERLLRQSLQFMRQAGRARGQKKER